MDEYLHNNELIINDSRTMMPGLMLSFKSDIMDCQVTWCRFAAAQSENLERPKHKHIVYEIHYLLNGKIDYYFPSFGAYTITKGQFMLIPRDVLHSTFCSDKNTEYLVIAFSLVSSNDTINIIFSHGCKPFCADFSPAMEGMIYSLKSKTHMRNFTDCLSTKVMVESILLEAIDAIMDSMNLSLTDTQTGSYEDPRVCTIERIVKENQYSEKLRGEDVAEELGMTTRQLNRICNKHFGCSINNYITNTRIESMKSLLSESYYTLRDISAIFGFSDVSLFIKHFTRCAGISPGKYRNINRQQNNSQDLDENVDESII